jgi:hypothetical protein
MAMKGFGGGLQATPIASVAHGYGLEVLVPHVRRQEVDKRCLEEEKIRPLALVCQCYVLSNAGVCMTGDRT